MENQINNQQGEKAISTTVGVTILVLIAIIIGMVIWKFKGDTESASNVPVVNVGQNKVQKEEVPAANTPAENVVSGSAAVQAGTTSPVAAGTKIDFTKELKDLDTAAGAVDSNDFGDTGLSNANLGL